MPHRRGRTKHPSGSIFVAISYGEISGRKGQDNNAGKCILCHGLRYETIFHLIDEPNVFSTTAKRAHTAHTIQTLSSYQGRYSADGWLSGPLRLLVFWVLISSRCLVIPDHLALEIVLALRRVCAT